MSKINKNLINYLKNPDLYESFHLGESGKLTFHWANSSNFLENVRNDSEIKRKIKDKIVKIKRTLENEPAWLISKQNQIESNIYEIYKYFLDPRLRELWFEVNDDITLSLRTVQGPYTRLQSMRWFDYEIYRAFVYEKLIRCTKMNFRNFRLGCSLNLEIIPTGVPTPAINVTISQIMEDGILLSIDSKATMQKICALKNARYKIDFSNLKKEVSYDSFKKGSESFCLNDDIFNLGKNRENSTYSNGKEYFLYISFKDIDDSCKENVKAPFIELIDLYKSYVDLHIAKVKKSNKVAA